MAQSYSRTLCGLSALALLGLASVSGLLAQEAGMLPGSGSLTTLTAEIHQLRLAVEESTRTQSQTQALAVYLSVQKDRVVQVAARLDSLRKDLDATTLQARRQSGDLTRLEGELGQAPSPEIRTAMMQQATALRRDVVNLTAQAEGLRAREADIAQSLQTEEARWADLISRLEQVIRR